MFPVHMKTKGSTEPASSPCYIVAKNGTFLRKKSWWMEAVVPVKQIAVLEEQNASIKLTLPPLSSEMLLKVWRFFKAVYEKHYAESAVLLHYSQSLGWELTVPEQKVTFSHVDYKMDERLEGHTFMGTMHSHSSMGAFHSGTDVGDEAQVDGIHITFGNLNAVDQFSMDAEVVINGTRFTMPVSLLEGVSIVEKPSSSAVQYLSPLGQKSVRYTISCPQLDEWKVPSEWMEKVSKGYVDVGVPTSGHGWLGGNDMDWGRALDGYDPYDTITQTLGLTRDPRKKIPRISTLACPTSEGEKL